MDDPIWFGEPDVGLLNQQRQHTLCEALDISLTQIGPNFVCGKMPVDGRTVQNIGLLHGGASVALAETLGSIGAYLTIDPEHFICVGQEVSASHLRSVATGWVTGKASPIHLGNSQQVWEIRIEDDKKRLSCISRLTVAIRRKRQ